MIVTPPSYGDMVDFLRRIFYRGIPLACELNDDYDLVKKEYTKHRILHNSIAGQVPIEIIKFTSSDVAEIMIADESRLVSFSWNDETSTGLSINKEVLCTPLDDSKKEILSRVLIVNNDDNFCVYPSEYTGDCVITWLSPHKNTIYRLVKGYLNYYDNINWRWIEACPVTQKIDQITSKYAICCKEKKDSLHDIVLNYPVMPTFNKISDRWIADHNLDRLTWLALKQSCIAYRYKKDTVVILQWEYGSADIARFLIVKQWHDKFCLMALIQCTTGNQHHKKGDTIIIPLIQLLPLNIL